MTTKIKLKKRKRKIAIASLIVLASLLLYIGWFFLSLPDVEYLKTKNPGTTSLMESRKKEARKKGKKLQILHIWVEFTSIPGLLKDTVRISEDAGFYFHKGIDYHELKEAIKKNWQTGKKTRGGSTITQQLAKNLYLSTEKSYYRKIREFFIAKKLEKELLKNRIFSLYLNLIEFGRGVFGIGAASETFFKKPVNRLNLSEIVRLAAVIPKPLRVSPLFNSRYLKWRANFLLDKLYKYDYISAEVYDKAKRDFKE
ncbi:MAG: transglycosylase domain-containing protein [Candidatus Aminicenantes bacterium]|nr:transglycosylase domain-containing protein [Candidatus Aminicenantes bacterium]